MQDLNEIAGTESNNLEADTLNRHEPSELFNYLIRGHGFLWHKSINLTIRLTE